MDLDGWEAESSELGQRTGFKTMEYDFSLQVLSWHLGLALFMDILTGYPCF